MRAGRIKLRSCKYRELRNVTCTANVTGIPLTVCSLQRYGWADRFKLRLRANADRQTDSSHEDPHALPKANHQTFIVAKTVGTQMQVNTKHIPYVRHPRSLAIWRTRKTKPNAPHIYDMRTFPCFIFLHFRSLRNPPHASERQYTTITAVVQSVVYRSNTGIVGPDHIRGVGVHLRLICPCIALCSYRPCGRPIPSPGKHKKCTEIWNEEVPGHIGLWHNRDNEEWRFSITW